MRPVSKTFLLFCSLLLSHAFLYSQVTIDADSLFSKARYSAFTDKNYKAAISDSKVALELQPGYDEVRIFLSRVYLWDRQPDSARLVLEPIQSKPDAILVMSEIALASGQADRAFLILQEALAKDKSRRELYAATLKLCLSQNKLDVGRSVAKEAIKLFPADAELLSLEDKIERKGLKNQVSISYDYTRFGKQFPDPWQQTSLAYSRTTRMGVATGRLTYGNRFRQQGVQTEIEAYPVISKKFYGYIGMAYSAQQTVFPRIRGGASLYANLKGGYEAEIGMRYLNFDRANWIATMSAGKYVGDFWFNLRSFIAPLNNTFIISSRYYMADGDRFISLSLSSGISPDERALNMQLQEIGRLSAQRGVLGYRFTQGKNIILAEASVASVEYALKTRDWQWGGMLQYARRW